MIRGDAWLHDSRVRTIFRLESLTAYMTRFSPAEVEILRIQGNLVGKESGSVQIDVLLCIFYAKFHEEDWKMATIIEDEELTRPLGHSPAYQDIRNRMGHGIFPPGRESVRGFTGVRMLRPGIFAICEEMKHFSCWLRTPTGQLTELVYPFDLHSHLISVHPNAMLLFARSRSQLLLMQGLCLQLQILPHSPRYWVGNDGMLVLEDTGRWRSQYALEWIAVYGYDGVPGHIQTELRILSTSDLEASRRRRNPPSSDTEDT